MLRETVSDYAVHFLQVGVVGLGLMGHGIAQVTADKGFQVVAVDASQEAVDRVRVSLLQCSCV